MVRMTTAFELFTGTAPKVSILPKTITNSNNLTIGQGIKSFNPVTDNQPYITQQIVSARETVTKSSPYVQPVTKVPDKIVQNEQSKLDKVGIISPTKLIYPSGSSDSSGTTTPEGLDTLSSGNNVIDKLTVGEKETIIKTQEIFKLPEFKLPEFPNITESLGNVGKYALAGLGLILAINLIKR
jgi:hypothetical protein